MDDSQLVNIGEGVGVDVGNGIDGISVGDDDIDGRVSDWVLVSGQIVLPKYGAVGQGWHSITMDDNASTSSC